MMIAKMTNNDIIMGENNQPQSVGKLEIEEFQMQAHE